MISKAQPPLLGGIHVLFWLHFVLQHLGTADSCSGSSGQAGAA